MATASPNLFPDEGFFSRLRRMRKARKTTKRERKNSETKEARCVEIVTDIGGELNSLEAYHRAHGRCVWLWEEGSDHIRKHKSSFIREGTNYVFFCAGVSNEIENEYQEWRRGAQTGSLYAINFQNMTQKKAQFERSVRREVRYIVDDFPSLPTAFFVGQKSEPFLSTRRGQIIEVSKEHRSKKWLQGKVVYDPDGKTGAAGWFLASFARPFVPGITGGLIKVDAGTEEYTKVSDYFMSKFVKRVGRDLPVVQVVSVERVQSKRLWRGYKQYLDAMREHYTEHPCLLENNNDIKGLERKWLFHGTTAYNMPKIIKQGFNRSFAGTSSGMKYGKGSYFSYYSSYSSSYAPADFDGIRRMFLCRVAVGDWCKGSYGKLTPDPKQWDQNELFDSTVNHLERPSIFVTYHDAQAFPEYLVSYKQTEV